nr:uncharacterized protein LOC133600537 [Nerophis lumbriciformis]
MHIKTGTWEASNTVCESDTLCDPAVLVASANPEPHIRNRRLSPGNCGGGGGGRVSPDLIGPGFRREKERKGPQYKGRGIRREGSQKGLNRAQKERWVEDSLSLLKPPPAFPVQDSPAKLQPAVSYASKVKAKTSSGVLEDERPAIGVLLQNQWGLSFISEARPVQEGADPRPDDDSLAPVDTPLAVRPFATSAPAPRHLQMDARNGELLLSCRHLVEALNFHNRDPKRVMWYKDFQEHPA